MATVDIVTNQMDVANNDSETSITPELILKHPLQNRWSLWFFKNDKSKEWSQNQKVVATVDTVEDFWALYNHIAPASRLPAGCDYSVFKEGIEPAWEDSRNKKGGRWLLSLNKSQRSDLDGYWLEILLCLIGEAFDEQSDDVNGAVVNIRPKGDKLALWTADATRSDSSKKIGKRMKERLNIHPKTTIGYQAHSDSMVKSGSTTKNRFTV